MNIGARDLFLISPELALVALAIVVVAIDLVVRRKGIVIAVAVVGLLAPTIAAVSVWNDIRTTGVEMAFNGALVVDEFALYFKFLTLVVLALLFMSSSDYASRFQPFQAEFFGLLLFSSAGLMLLPAAGDLITVYISLELASLPVIALVAYNKAQLESTEAGLKYLVLSVVSSAVLLYGFAFLYGATGTLRLVSFDPGNPAIGHMLINGDPSIPFGGVPVMVGIVLAVAGFGFKLSIVPFQMWTPDVYEGAPTPVAAYLAVASKAAAFAVVLRVFYSGLDSAATDWSLMFAVLAAITMTVGNVVAIAQSNVKRLLGYSAIAQAGYMLVGVAAYVGSGVGARSGAELGIESVLFYLAGYAAMNLTAFFAVMAISNRTSDDTIEGLAGMGRRAPMLAAVLALALLSLTGIPPTVGFIGKLFLFNAAINADLVWLAVIGVLNSVVSAYYYVGIVRVMYLREPDSPARISVPPHALAALAVAAAGILVLGLWPGGLLEVARQAALDLL
jgi:NADH-quinone oxidoreductase subunit N